MNNFDNLFSIGVWQWSAVILIVWEVHKILDKYEISPACIVL